MTPTHNRENIMGIWVKVSKICLLSHPAVPLYPGSTNLVFVANNSASSCIFSELHRLLIHSLAMPNIRTTNQQRSTARPRSSMHQERKHRHPSAVVNSNSSLDYTPLPTPHYLEALRGITAATSVRQDRVALTYTGQKVAMTAASAH